MVDETGFQDTFGDGDLADPSMLPENTKFLGEITKVDVSGATPGNFRKFNNLKDGRTEVPVIDLTLRAKKLADGSPIVGNFNTLMNLNFWVGSTDVIGRSSLARLAASVLGCRKEGFAGQTLTGVAEQLLGGKVSFEVKVRDYVNRDGEDAKVQGPTKVKAATEQEMALLM